MWDFVEGNPIGQTSGNYHGALNWVSLVIQHTLLASSHGTPSPNLKALSATATSVYSMLL
jgi:hypothetical protein